VCLGPWLGAGPAAAARMPNSAANSTPTPTATASLIPAGPPPGERNPVQGAVAVIAIVVAAGAGFFIYRVIRKGL
jgi:hypothetical protein